jgi:hypothetical protein
MPKKTEKREVFAVRNLPGRMPLGITLLLWLLLDRLQPKGWVWGAVSVLVVMLWGMWIWDVTTRDEVPLDDFARKQER